jgi:hypothetical protein
VTRALLAAAAAAALALAIAPAAFAIDTVNTERLRSGVTVDGILEHERAFQNIATAHGSTRAATTPGYDASVDYVVNRLRRAGYVVSLDEFDFPDWTKNGPSHWPRSRRTRAPGWRTPTTSCRSSPVEVT